MRYRRRQAERWPQREQARKDALAAIRSGLLVRQSCERCSAHPAHAHHDDYGKPLDVRWLCRPCHTAHHTAERRQNAAQGKPKKANEPEWCREFRAALKATR